MLITKPSSVIDIHTHVIADDQTRYPLAPLSGTQSAWSRERPVSYGQMLADMKQAGVDQAVLVQASTCYGNDNRYVVEAVKAHPEQFAGVFSVAQSEPDSVAQIANWMGQGLDGMRVFIAGHTTADQGASLDDPRAYTAWEYAQELRIPISVQLRAHGLAQLASLLQRFPDAVVILDHFARPVLEDGPPYALADGLFALAQHANLHFKLTTHNIRESLLGKATQASFLQRVVDVFGASRIAWGSNYPASPGSLAGLLEEGLEACASLSAEDREWIFNRTARALYPALAAQQESKV